MPIPGSQLTSGIRRWEGHPLAGAMKGFHAPRKKRGAPDFSLPAVFTGLYTNWFHCRALIVGWVGGMMVGTWMVVAQNFLSSVYPMPFPGFQEPRRDTQHPFPGTFEPGRSDQQPMLNTPRTSQENIRSPVR
jgi:hypothetical protein